VIRGSKVSFFRRLRISKKYSYIFQEIKTLIKRSKVLKAVLQIPLCRPRP
jgi:hypothetical protein